MKTYKGKRAAFFIDNARPITMGDGHRELEVRLPIKGQRMPDMVLITQDTRETGWGVLVNDLVLRECHGIVAALETTPAQRITLAAKIADLSKGAQ